MCVICLCSLSVMVDSPVRSAKDPLSATQRIDFGEELLPQDVVLLGIRNDIFCQLATQSYSAQRVANVFRPPRLICAPPTLGFRNRAAPSSVPYGRMLVSTFMTIIPISSLKPTLRLLSPPKPQSKTDQERVRIPARVAELARLVLLPMCPALAGRALSMSIFDVDPVCMLFLHHGSCSPHRRKRSRLCCPTFVDRTFRGSPSFSFARCTL